MTSVRLLEALDQMQWSRRSLAEATGYDERQVRRWLSGAPIPSGVAAWVEMVARWHEAHPAPRRVR